MRMIAVVKLGWWLAGVSLAWAGVPGLQAITAEEIVDRWVERVQSADRRLPAEKYRCRRLTTIEELNSQGEVVERKTKEHRVVQEPGVSRVMLVRQDGREVATSQAREEERREKDQRRQYAERASARRRGMEQVDEALIRRFQYVLEGFDRVDGRPVHVLRFQPDPGAAGGDTIADRALGRLAGRVWIDAEESELVRLECSLISPLNLFGGVVGTVDRLDLLIWRQRLPGGTWVNRSIHSRLEGRKLVSRFRARMRVEQEDFVEIPPVTPPASP